jgi:Ser/Thr protein kinase RdoA (MazF antagonist)
LLQQSQVAHYLLSLGLVKPRAVIEEDLTITDVSRRNSVFLATTADGPTYVVKQARPETEDTLAHEAAVLRALGREPALADLVPELVHHDHAPVRLVLRSPAGAIAWGEHARVPCLAAGALGRALAAVHAAHPQLDAALESDPPWGLTLPEPALERLRGMSAGALDVLALIQSSRELCDRLERLRESTSGDAFVHGDLRWDNCLTRVAPGSTRRTRVLLIDWELAGTGDPAADVGTALAEYLRLWVGSVPIVDPRDPSRLAKYARHSPSRLQPAIRALWSGYAHSATKPVAVRRATEFAAVRLLETALEYAQGFVHATAEVGTLVRVAANTLRRPDLGARHVLGLTP